MVQDRQTFLDYVQKLFVVASGWQLAAMWKHGAFRGETQALVDTNQPQ